MSSILWWFSAPSTNNADLVGNLLQYGVLGIVAIVLFFVARNLIEREQKRADRLEEDNRRITDLMTDSMIPALTKATEAIASTQQLIGEMKREHDIEVAMEARMREHLGRRPSDG